MTRSRRPSNPAPAPYRGPGWPTFASELLRARASLTLIDHIGLALRAHRSQLGLSQRAYARLRHRSKSAIAKLETQCDQVALSEVMDALTGTGYALQLAKTSDEGPERIALPVAPEHWDRVELLARVRGGGRRFPAHRPTQQVTVPPKWWWDRESTDARSVSPHWYCPDLGATHPVSLKAVPAQPLPRREGEQGTQERLAS